MVRLTKPLDLILIAPVTAQAMRHLSAQAAPLETGGVLVGYIEGATGRVVHLVGPGPQAKHSRNYFMRDGNHAQEEVNKLYWESGAMHDYIGEWHSHTQNVGISSTDAKSMAEIGTSISYHTAMPLLLLCVCVKHQWIIKAYQWQSVSMVEISCFEDDNPELTLVTPE